MNANRLTLSTLIACLKDHREKLSARDPDDSLPELLSQAIERLEDINRAAVAQKVHGIRRPTREDLDS